MFIYPIKDVFNWHNYNTVFNPHQGHSASDSSMGLEFLVGVRPKCD